jgi:hypothetical protein
MSAPDEGQAGDTARVPRSSKDKLAFDAIGTVLKGDFFVLHTRDCGNNNTFSRG